MPTRRPPVARRLLNTVPTCPAPTCACAETPAMPEGLPIDQGGKLHGLIASYAQQVLVCTGKDDWPSRIEDDNNGDNLAADLKELLGRGGTYSDVSCPSPCVFLLGSRHRGPAPFRASENNPG